MKAKILNIMNYSPAYDLFSNEPRPVINWNTPNGKWVGMWGLDVPDLLAEEFMKLTNDFEYEVWQPDLHADKVYKHRFEAGSVRRNFPAKNIRKLFGAKFVYKIHSEIMLKELQRESRKVRIILHLNGSPLQYKYFIDDFWHLPIIFDFRGAIFLPLTRFFSFTRNFPSKLHHVLDHYWLRKNISKVDFIIYRNDKNIQQLREIYTGALQKLTSGCDFSFWRPGDKSTARNRLALPGEKPIFFTASRLAAGKQIERMIRMFTDLADKYDFLLIVAGHGHKSYEDYLREISLELLNRDKVRFVGFLTGEKFRTYYNASDFFILTSISEGAPVAVMNAFACGVPVISTKIGHTAELLEQYNCGCLLDTCHFDMWKNEIVAILEGKREVKTLDREVAKKYYDWPIVAQKYKNVYEYVAQKYYS